MALHAAPCHATRAAGAAADTLGAVWRRRRAGKQPFTMLDCLLLSSLFCSWCYCACSFFS
jgi:hypothetical protein